MSRSCSSLTSLDLSNLNTENIEDMNGMFAYLYNLESLDLPNFKTPNLGQMLHTFESCQKLKSLDLSSFKTTKLWTFNMLFLDVIHWKHSIYLVLILQI